MCGMSGDDYEQVREIKERNRDRLMGLPNVVGVGIGRKVVEGRYTDQIAIRVYVTEKVPPERLKNEQRIPEEVDGVPTDVVEAGEIRLLGKYANETQAASGSDSAPEQRERA